MDDIDVFEQLRGRVVRYIEQRETELVPFCEYVCTLEKVGYDSTAARYILEHMRQELANWRQAEFQIEAFSPCAPLRARA